MPSIERTSEPDPETWAQHPHHRARSEELMDEWLTSVVVWWDDDDRPHVLAGPGAEPLPGEAAVVHVLTSQDPYGEPQTPERNHELLVDLHRWARTATDAQGRPLRWWPASGGSLDDDHAEHGIAIASLERSEAAAIGRALHQLAIYEVTAREQIVVPCPTPDEVEVTARTWPADRTWPDAEVRVRSWWTHHAAAR